MNTLRRILAASVLGVGNLQRVTVTDGKARVAFRACCSATFRNFARSAHFYEQGQSRLFPAINILNERVDVALRWHGHCSKSGRTAPQCTASYSRRHEEGSMMSTHGSAAFMTASGSA